MTPETVLLWSAAVILAALALAALVFLGFVAWHLAIKPAVEAHHRRRMNGLTSKQIRAVRAYADRLREQNEREEESR